MLIKLKYYVSLCSLICELPLSNLKKSQKASDFFLPVQIFAYMQISHSVKSCFFQSPIKVNVKYQYFIQLFSLCTCSRSFYSDVLIYASDVNSRWKNQKKF